MLLRLPGNGQTSGKRFGQMINLLYVSYLIFLHWQFGREKLLETLLLSYPIQVLNFLLMKGLSSSCGGSYGISPTPANSILVNNKKLTFVCNKSPRCDLS